MAKKIYNFHVENATRENLYLRVLLSAASGHGKTGTGLRVGTALAEKFGAGDVVVIDSEERSSCKYAWSDRTKTGFKFKVLHLPEDDKSPAAYMAALAECARLGVKVVIIDSLTHAWTGINGVLEQVDTITDASRSKNAFNEGWKAMSPQHNRLIQAILCFPGHVIATVRADEHYELKQNTFGKLEPTKTGLAPVQRKGMSFEFDLHLMMSNVAGSIIGRVDKTRIEGTAIGDEITLTQNDKVQGCAAFADMLVAFVNDTERTGEPINLGDAVNMAVAAGIVAGKAKDQEGFKAARAALVTWCARRGVSQARAEGAVAEMKARVTEALPPKPGEAAPPPSDRGAGAPAAGDQGAPVDPAAADAARLRDIDQGRA